jgi:hypothetical protein
MEAASWLAGEPWSAAPRAVHSVIAGVARQINDSVSDEERQRLWPLILASLDTARRVRPILKWRLHRFAKRALASGAEPMSGVWLALLDRFAELTGDDPWQGGRPELDQRRLVAFPPMANTSIQPE